jgi:ketosteroid isomerase-like protein
MDKAQIATIFSGLENGRPEDFFKYVAEEVAWTVMGTHPLAGTYHSKTEFREATMKRLSSLMKGDKLTLHTEQIWLDGDTAIVELSARAVSKKGTAFNNRYCWVCRFELNQIVEVRAYLDSALVKQVIKESTH